MGTVDQTAELPPELLGSVTSGYFRLPVELSAPSTTVEVTVVDAVGCRGTAQATYNVQEPVGDEHTVIAYYGYWFVGQHARYSGASEFGSLPFFQWGPPNKEDFIGSTFSTALVDDYDAGRVVGPDPWRRDIRRGDPRTYPYIGPYDTLDPEVMRWHIRLAQAAGLDSFLVYSMGNLGPFGAAAIDNNLVSVVSLLPRSDGLGSYLIDSFGGAHRYGTSREIPAIVPYIGSDALRDAVLLDDDTTVVALDRDGNLVNGAVLSLNDAPLAACSGVDQGRALSVADEGRAAMVLIGSGQVCAAGTAVDPAWPADPESIDVLLTTDGLGAYLLKRDGSVAVAGTAEPVSGFAPPGTEGARRLALSSDHLFRLDADGRVYGVPRRSGVDLAPSFDGHPVWPGMDVATDIVIVGDGAGVVILDRYGNTWRDGAVEPTMVVDPRDAHLPSPGELFSVELRGLWLLKRISEEEGFHFSLGDFTFGLDGLGQPTSPPQRQAKFDRWVRRSAYLLTPFLQSSAYFRIDGHPHFETVWFWDYYADYREVPAVDIGGMIDGLQARVSQNLFVSAYLGWDPRGVIEPSQLRELPGPGVPAEFAAHGVDAVSPAATINGFGDACLAELETAMSVMENDQQSKGYLPAAGVNSGFDESGTRHRVGLRIRRRGGRRFRGQLDAAFSAGFPLVFVQHWHEWTEGSQIEPSLGFLDAQGVEDPYVYLRQLAEAQGREFVEPPLPPPLHLEPLRRQVLFPQACPGDCVDDVAGRTETAGDCFGEGTCVEVDYPCEQSGPVCGWDGNTYANDCVLGSIRVLHEGACGVYPIPCVEEPQCGLDGRTYPSECALLDARVHRAHPGRCAPWRELWPNTDIAVGFDPFVDGIVSDFAASAEGAYMIDTEGGVQGAGAMDHCPLMTDAPGLPVSPDRTFRSVALGNSGDIYLLLGDGTVTATPNAALSQAALWPGQDLARRLVVPPQGSGVLIVDESCELPVSDSAPDFRAQLPGGLTACVAAAYTPTGLGLYVVDRLGQVATAGDATSLDPTPVFGFDIARDLVARSDGNGYYVLDGLGGVHAGGGAPLPRADDVAQWYNQGNFVAIELVDDLRLLILRDDGRIFLAQIDL